MSLIVKLDSDKFTFNKSNTNELINHLEKYANRGIDMSVTIIDNNTLDFHSYVFTYLDTSKLSARKWILNNILYSVSKDETRYLFDDILDILYIEYNKA